MSESVHKLPIKTEDKSTLPISARTDWHPLESLRREIDRVFDLFDHDNLRMPFARSLFGMPVTNMPATRRQAGAPGLLAIDLCETDKAFEILAELPGLSDKDIEVRVAHGGLTIRGEKRAIHEERHRDYHVSERSFGAFQRSFALPEGVDADRIEAQFKNGILTVTLPKTAEAQRAEKKITVKAA